MRRKNRSARSMQNMTIGERKRMCYDYVGKAADICSSEWEKSLMFGELMKALEWAYGTPRRNEKQKSDIQPP